MKKTLSVLAAAAVLSGTLQDPFGNAVFSISDNFVSGQEQNMLENGLIYEYILFSGCIITGCDKDAEEIEIPSQIEGIPVISIREGAFKDCTKLRKIVIPYTISSIEQQTFSNCISLEEVILPEAICTIGDHAFSNCSSLTGIKIPNTCREIGEEVFAGCTSLSNIDYSGSYAMLPDGFAEGTPWYDSIENVDGLIIINDVLTDGQNASGNVTVPSSVKKISKYAFSGNKAITSVEIPDSITEIGDHAFGYCSSLEKVKLPEKLTAISESTFTDCQKLSDVVIPDSVKIIGESAFYKCTSLKSAEIPEGVTEIGAYAFYECTSVETISVPESVETIGDKAFSTAAFPEQHIFFGSGNFGDLISITVDPDNKYYCDVDGILFDKSMETLIQCPASYECPEYRIPDGVKTVGSKSFFGCTGIGKIECPDSLTLIESSAFEMCTSLYNISLSKNLREIGYDAFSNCRDLCKITIPESVEKIGGDAFFYADLDEITIENPDIELPSRFLVNRWENIDGMTEFSYTGVIYGKEDSTAQKYAEENDIIFALGKGEEGIFSYNRLPDGIEITHIEDPADNYGSAVLDIPESIEGLPVVRYRGSSVEGYSTVNLPSGIKSVKYDLVYSVNRIFNKTAQINVSADNPYLTSADGVLFSKDMKTILCYPSLKKDKEYVIPEGVNVIAAGAIEYTDLEKIVFPKTLKDIEDRFTWSYNTMEVEGYDNTPAKEFAEYYGYNYTSLGTAPDLSAGDMDEDGEITVADMLILKKYLLNSDIKPENADVNGDGEADIFDLMRIRRVLLNDYVVS